MPISEPDASQRQESHPCRFPIRDHARNAGPPKKSFRSEALILKLCSCIDNKNK